MRGWFRRWLLGDIEQRLRELEFSTGIDRKRERRPPPVWLDPKNPSYLKREEPAGA